MLECARILAEKIRAIDWRASEDRAAARGRWTDAGSGGIIRRGDHPDTREPATQQTRRRGLHRPTDRDPESQHDPGAFAGSAESSQSVPGVILRAMHFD